MAGLELVTDEELARLTGLDKEHLERQYLVEQIVETRAKGMRAELEAMHAIGVFEDEQASGDSNRTVYFIADINESSVFEAVSATSRWARRDPGEPITLKINSPGGMVSETLALYDHLRMLSKEGTPIITIGIGEIASGAGVIFQAGDKRLMTPNAFMLIHEVAGGLRGKTSNVAEDLASMQRKQRKLLEILAERSSMTADEIDQRWTGKEWWLDAAEAVKLGFADGIV